MEKSNMEFFRTKCQVDQSKNLSDITHKIGFPKPPDALKKSLTSNASSNPLNVKNVSGAQVLIDIAKSRGLIMS